MAKSEIISGTRRALCLTLFVLFSLVSYCRAVYDCKYLDTQHKFEVKEDAGVGFVVANVSAYSLRIKHSNNDKYKNLLNVTKVSSGLWHIYVQEPLDIETMSNVQIGAGCQDDKNSMSAVEFDFGCQHNASSGEQEISVYFSVDDVNEYAPEFVKPDFIIPVSETTKNGTSIFRVEACDPDIDTAKTEFSFKILDGDDGYFGIIEQQYSADIVLTKALDFDKGPTKFILNISATEIITDGKTNYTTLTINVIDEDDLMPEFLNVSYTLSVQEGHYVGHSWFQTTPVLSARDGDLHLNQTIEFKIGEGTHAMYNKLFSVAQNGSIGIDGYLHAGTYSVLILACQTDSPSLRCTTTIVTVTVTDANDHTPKLDQVQYRVSVSESASPGTVVLMVTAQDEDVGNNSVVLFHLNGTGNGKFNITTNFLMGIIQVASQLNRETKAEYNFEVWAEETMTHEHYNSTKSKVLITVLDENDNAPHFDQSEYTFNSTITHHSGDYVGQDCYTLLPSEAWHVLFSFHNTGQRIQTTKPTVVKTEVQALSFENPSDGDVVIYTDGLWFIIRVVHELQVSASDPDQGVNGQVTFTTYSSAFAIDDITGTITLKKDFSYSEIGAYNFTIIATDMAVDTSKRRSTFAQVTVNMLPDNTISPVFVNTPYNFNVSETTPLGFLVGQVTASDVDGGVIHYTAAKNDYLHVNLTNGKITLIKEVDLDSNTPPAQYINIKVYANDGAHTVETDMKVTLLYVNEFQPKWDHLGPFTVFQNATQDTDIGKVTATDRDKGPDGTVTYSLVATTTSNLFKIDARSGQIKLNCSVCLDRDSYDIIVQATDGGRPPFYDTMSFHVKVEKTVFEPPLFLEKVYHVLLTENQPAQTVLQLSAIDADTPQNHLSYSIGHVSPPAAASLLQIFPNGTVYINCCIDAEVLNYFVANVSVTDGQRTDSANIIVNITDINDNSPALNITALGPISVPENSKVGTFVAAVGATDEDVTNSGFAYFLTDGTEGKFHINVTSGVITLAELLDRRQKKMYNITVNVLDHGMPPALGSGNLVVEVTDSNTAPYFVNASNHNVSNYVFAVNEDLMIGELIGSLYASDPDVGSSGQLTFHFQSGDSPETFLLEKETGNITLARSLNFEGKKRYVLTAVVRDYSYHPRSASATVTINVRNVPEAPQWPQPLSTVYITQSSICKNQQQHMQAFSQELATISSHSDDSVEYFLLNMTDVFFINQTTGLLKILKTQPEGIYTLSLKACNKGTNVCSNATLPVKVQNEDIFAFCPTFYTVRVNESAGINFTFLDLNTTKFDYAVKYYISGGNADGKFGIGENDGKLYVASALDREKTWSYTLLVLAEDTDNHDVAEAQVIISVLDAPDEVPEFSAKSYQGEVMESQNSGSPVYVPFSNSQLLVTATDRDENPQLSYSINHTSDTSNGSFQIDKASGALSLARTVDYESIPASLNQAYTFAVLATDGILTNSATVTVHVRDDNDNPPHFDHQGDLFINVTEGPTSVKEIATIGASDSDTNTKFVYTLSVISPTGTGQLFDIDKSSGKLRVIQELDREEKDEHILNITVSDGKFNISKLVTVTVLDINDNSPQFNKTFNMTVKEGNAGLNRTIHVIAYDADTGPNADLIYSIVSGNVNGAFAFDTKLKNVLRTVKVLDREAIVHNGASDILLIIQAVDSGSPPKTGTGSVIVTVKDINDNEPHFSQNIYYASVSEDVTNSTVILNPPLNVTNADSDDCAGFRYSLSNNTIFDVHEDTGELFVKGKLDREVMSSCSLLITVVDDCGQGLSSSATIDITITDVNDEVPHFLQDAYYFNISRNSSLYQSVGVIIAKDNDITGSHDVTYKLTGSHMFYINPVSGDIMLIGDLGRETTDIYNFTVSACDDISQCGYATVYIDVTDMRDKCPVWNLASMNLKVMEGQNPGSLGFISAHEKDFSSTFVLSYIFNDTAGMKFIEINNRSGEVTLLKQLKADRSDNNNLSFSVYAEDNGSSPCAQPGTLTITVTGTNDNDPEICYQGQCGFTDTKIILFDKSRAGALVALVTTRDNDTGVDGEVILNLTVKESRLTDLFSLSNKGIISLKKQVILTDLKKDGTIQGDEVDIILVARDKGQVSRSSNATIKVEIVAAPADVPVFSETSYNLTFSENEKPGTNVGTVTVTSPPAVSVDYSISTPLGIVPFIINRKSGVITTTMTLDREAVRLYLFVVQAVNPNHPTLPVSTLIMVTVEDVNEPPRFDKSNITVKATEETAPIDLVTLKALDNDDGTNGSISYKLLSPSLYQNFAVNQRTGVLTVTHPLDRETKSSYDLIIQAVDGGIPPLSATVLIHIIVTDLNDHAPVFTSSVYEHNITKSEPPVKVVMVTASDADEGLNQKIIYSLESHLFTFRIDPLTGEIETVSVPDTNIFTLVVIATDQGNPPLNGTADVIVRILDNRTDIEPILSFSTDYVQLFVGMTVGTQVLVNITVIDADVLIISGGNGTDVFKLEKGKIILNKDLSQEAVYVLNITARSTTLYSVSKQLWIHVTSVRFSQQSYVAVLPENSNIPHIILDISSYAEDVGMPVHYSLTVPDTAFDINSSTGVLWVLHALDREKFPVYVLNVSLSLDHSTSRTTGRRKRAVDTSQTFASVLVRVEDQNDNVPSFGSLGPELLLSVSENVNTSYLITTLKAFDPDEGLNGLIRYSILDGDSGAFDLNPVTGELIVASREKLKSQLSFTLTVVAVDRNGAGSNSSSLLIKISVIQDGYKFRLQTPLPLSVLETNKQAILSGLSQILGFNISLEGLIVDETSSDRSDILLRAYVHPDINTTTYLSANQIDEIVSKQHAEIDRLFKSFMTQPSSDDDSLNTTSIALIAVAGAMFLVALVAIIVSCRLWKHRKEYEQKEEDALKVRHRQEDQTDMDNKKGIRMSSNQYEHLEMSTVSEVAPATAFVNPQAQEQTVNEHLQHVQQSLRPLASESVDSGIAFPLNSNSEGSRQESPTRNQKNVNVERKETTSSSEENTAEKEEGSESRNKVNSQTSDETYKSVQDESKQHETVENGQDEQLKQIPTAAASQEDTSLSPSQTPLSSVGNLVQSNGAVPNVYSGLPKVDHDAVDTTTNSIVPSAPQQPDLSEDNQEEEITCF